jgi:hypothetical protein
MDFNGNRRWRSKIRIDMHSLWDIINKNHTVVIGCEVIIKAEKPLAAR